MIDTSSKLLMLLTGLSIAGVLQAFLGYSATSDTNTPEEMLRQAAHQFAKAADDRNLAQLDEILHDHFRVVANRLGESTTVNLLTKPLYLQLIADGKLGGDKRAVKIESIEIIQNNAAVRVTLTGKTLTIQSFYHFVKNEKGDWQLIQDLPYATKNN